MDSAADEPDLTSDAVGVARRTSEAMARADAAARGAGVRLVPGLPAPT